MRVTVAAVEVELGKNPADLVAELKNAAGFLARMQKNRAAQAVQKFARAVEAAAPEPPPADGEAEGGAP